MKAETVRKSSNNGAHLLNIHGNLSNNNNNNHMNANLFNTYFLTIADELIANSASDNNGTLKNNNLLNYLFQIFKHPFTNVKFTNTFTEEIEKNYQIFETQKLCLHLPPSHTGSRFLMIILTTYKTTWCLKSQDNSLKCYVTYK
jgi:hypothetical protein